MYFYFILGLNLTLMAVNGFLWIPKKLVFFLLYLIVSGFLGMAGGTVSTVALAKDLAGIIPSALYFAGFFRWMNFDVKKCFAFYARLASYAAAFGIVYLPFQSFPVGRLKSVCLEPSGYALLILPALFYYGDLWQRERKYALRFIVILVSLILTGSSLGFLGLFFGMYLFGTRYRFGKLLAPGLIAVVALVSYNTVGLLRQRANDTVVGAFQGNIGDINQSTFGTVINYFIARRAFEEHPLLGGGLGSYKTFHDLYFPLIPGTEFIFDQERTTLGQWDASSLLFRIAAEFGMVGLIASAWFLWRYWPRGGSPEERSIAMAILVYVFAKFVRDGIYFNPEVFFFFAGYAVNGLLAQKRNAARVFKLAPIATQTDLASATS